MYIKTITTLTIIAVLLLAAAGIPDVLADELTAPQPITNGSHVALALENHTYYPNDIIRFYVQGATAPAATIIDPVNSTYAVPLTAINNTSYLGEYSLSQGIILGNYTVIAADSATGETAQDSFEVTTHIVNVSPTPVPQNNTTTDQTPLYLYINLSKTDYLPGDRAIITVSTNAGTPTVVVQDPANNTANPSCKKVDNTTYSATFGLDRAIVLGNYTVLAYVNGNGTYCSAIAGFNVSAGNKKADKGMHIQYAAYDPSQKAIVLRTNVTANATDAANIVRNDPAMKGRNIRSVKVLGASNASANIKEDRRVDVTIPVDNNNASAVVSQYGLNQNITKATTSVAVSADGENIHLSLNNKLDGSWYRMSVPVPAGYQVQQITRADGTVITNSAQVDRSTGQTTGGDINWYVDNGTLYFYDDPINGYDITLQPPMASNSLAVNVITAGQLSAIVYPFNQTDSATTISGNDHLGYSGDNGYAYNIDADAGSKTGIRMYSGNTITAANRMIFGNAGSSYHTYSSATYNYSDNGMTTVGFNTVPDGSVESVVLSNFYTPSAANPTSMVNITQKTIIRNNNLWFATVYYITNTGTTDINSFRFYEGCDFNFNGNYVGDDDFYDATNDAVYGYKNNVNANSIHVGGFGSPLRSAAHDETDYGTMWTHISTDALNNATNSGTGVDGGMALAWDNSSLKKGQTWVIPVIWAVGQNNTVFTQNLNYATTHNIYDVGIESIDTPLNGDNVDSTTTPSLAINAVAMDVGVTDQSPVVSLQVTNSAGTTVYSASKTVQLSVPYQETAPANFNWNLAGVPAGTYTITVSTGMAGDQNTTNDKKSITVNVRDFSLYPDQSGQVNPGDNVFYTLTLANMGTSRTFDLTVSASSAGWPTYLYYKDSSILIAEDDNGDGTWDSVNNAYKDSNGLPCIPVTTGVPQTLLVQKLAPTSADTALIDTTTLKATPSNQPSVISMATLTTNTPFPSLATKTFYMHAKTLNTAPETVASQSIAVSSIFAMWSQTPAFADNFVISGNINVPLYYTTSTASGSMPITVTLFYTDGAGNTVLIGSSTSALTFSSSVTSKNFTITPAGGSITVPKGSYLVLKVDNQQTTTLNIYYDSTHRTCVQVNTPTYVHVSSVATYNGATATSNFAPGDTATIKATVNDPIGAYDIPSARISITSSSGTLIVNNQSMTLASTDPSNPALWKSFTYSAPLSGSLAPGVYTVSVTGYESNGVTHTKTTQITVVSTTPAVLIVPNNSRITTAGTTWTFKHTVTNLNGARNDVIDIAATGTMSGWTIGLYKADGTTPLPDTDSDGKPDTGTLGPLTSTDIVVKITVPSSASPGAVDAVSIVAASSVNSNIKSTATDTLIIPTVSVVKTLYLHDNTNGNGGTYLDTSPASSASNHETIAKSGSDDWGQTPVFARNFNILDDPTVTLYLLTTSSQANLDVSLISMNGATQTTIGSLLGYQPTVTNGAITQVSFTIPLSSPNTTIPAGNNLILRIVNNNNKQTVDVYGSSQYPSRIDMDTSSYINVQSVSLLDTSNNPVSSVTPPSTVRVRANITDPFGSFDITGASLTVKDANDNVVIAPMAMTLSSTDGTSPSLYKIYQNDVALPLTLDTGNYQFIVTATESNGVQHTLSSVLAVKYPISVSVHQSVAASGTNTYTVTISLTNKDTHTVKGMHAYDFYSSGFSVSGFSDSHVNAQSVNNGIISGMINIFGPFDLAAGETKNITFTATGSGNYNLSDFQVVGVDPDA